MLLSLVIPFIKISSFKHIISQEYIITLPEVLIGNTQQIVVNDKPFLSWELVFYLGVGLTTILFVFKLVNLLVLFFKSPKYHIDHVLIVSLLKSNMAFSFFNFIFLGEYLKTEERASILKHEMVHVKQKHTLDLLFFEVLRILFWFNPLVYMYQNRIMVLHEFLADAEAVKNQSKNKYYQSLLSQVFETKHMSFTNPFFKQSLIKKRIVMLQKSKSKQVSLFKYVLLIPMVFGMLVYTSCEKQSEDLNKDKIEVENDTNLSNSTYFLDGHEVSYETIQNIKPETIDRVNVLKDKAIIIEKYGDNSKNSIIEVFIKSKNTEESELFSLDEVEVPFGVVEHVPVFSGCESLDLNEGQKDCMSKGISEFVNKNFNTKLANKLGLKGRQRINVIFKINTEGNIVGVRSRAPHPELEAEAIRVIKSLPKFKPGIQKGKVVSVPYSLPIIFAVAE